MLASLALTAALTVPCGGQPPAPLSPFDGVPRPRLRDPQTEGDRLLEKVRWGLEMTQLTIDLAEQHLRICGAYLSAEQIREAKADLVTLRRGLETLKELERGLVAAGATMPLPRAPYPRKRPRVD